MAKPLQAAQPVGSHSTASRREPAAARTRVPAFVGLRASGGPPKALSASPAWSSSLRGGIRLDRKTIAASASGSAEAAPFLDGSDSSGSSSPDVERPGSPSPIGGFQLGATVVALAVLTVLCALAVSRGGGVSGVADAFSNSGFAAAFSLIFVSEIGDKTFFIAALLAMRHSRSIVLAGSVSALGLMSVISAVIGRVFREVPAQLKTSVPIGEYLACALLVWFGISSIRSALAAPTVPAAGAEALAHPSPTEQEAERALGTQHEDEASELAEAREYVAQATASKSTSTAFAAFWETFSLVFLAEWGDRSMLATIALGAAQSPVGVALGATWGHLLATAIAVVGGALLSQHISERMIGLTGGVLFLAFAAATLLGYS